MSKPQKLKIHLIGIGGIGLSALAQYYLSKKHIVSGSDLVNSEIIGLLKKKKAKVCIGKHKAKNVPLGADLVIYSPAVNRNNPELEKAFKLKIKTKTYPQALGDLTREFFTIAVSGTHGKSTTSAMTSLVLVKAGLDPTVIIGTKLKEFDNSNFRKGKSKYLVIEADEYKRSFLNYNPEILVLTNIEKDHLDYYKGLRDISNAFRDYIKRVNRGGFLIVNKDDENISTILKNEKLKKQFKTKKYSIKQPEAEKIKEILKVPGNHNVSNALAALECARVLGLKDREIFQSLSEFKGSWRRFEVFKLKNIILISDYAHHPTEIQKTLKAAREKYPDRKIRCIFQPHQHLRTFYLFDDFVKVIKNAPVDEMILCEVYDVPGRENKKILLKSTSEEIYTKINEKKITYRKNLKQAADYIKKTSKKNDVIIVMGAGDIYNLFLDLKKYLEKIN